MTGGGEKGLELYPPIEQGKIQFRNIDDVLYHQFERRSEIEIKSILRPILNRLLKIWNNRVDLRQHLRPILSQ